MYAKKLFAFYMGKILNHWRRGRKCLSSNTVDLVFLTKHKQALKQEHLERLKTILEETCIQMKCQLINFSGSAGHVYLSILIHPTISISTLVGKLKSKSSYLIVKEFPLDLKDKTINNHFWASSYASASGKNISNLILEFITRNS